MNRLGQETSPYLRQHRDNPVDWHPWGDEAFAEARRRDVPVHLSVGYSACHWCHVMAHECFEDDEVAAVMNAGFVNIKVDREERPDVDAVYMDAVQAMTGRGGWPMTVFLSPDGKPFYGGTYFPKPTFLQLLAAISDVWGSRRDELQGNIDALVEAIGRTSDVAPASDLPPVSLVHDARVAIASGFDPEWGGFGGAPKFPSTMALDLFVRHAATTGDPHAREIVTTSLDAMASGGIYDHIGGGFARYSVDREWLVPHFEKMLYDQALLVRVYTHATISGLGRWYQVVDETVSFVVDELRHESGGFYSAYDADSPDEQGHGHEGLFHTWTVDEVRAVLGDRAAPLIEWYGIIDAGNFEGRNIPHRSFARGVLERPPIIEEGRRALYAARRLRRPPGLDDKVLTEWNALMLASLAEAAALFGRDDWRDVAAANGEFLWDNLRGADGRWFRSWQADGRPRARHRALAADHACLIDAYTRLGEATGSRRWIDAAVEVADVMLDHFWDPRHGGLFTTPDDGEQLVVRQKDLMDNATPSANSTAANALLRLGALTGISRFGAHAEQILRLLGRLAPNAPSAFANAIGALDLVHHGLVEVAVVGPEPDLVSTVRRTWNPYVVLAAGEPFGGPLWADRRAGAAYVCRNYTCDAPIADPHTLSSRLRLDSARS